MKVDEAALDSPVKITVLGGCHILGFLVGRENGFVSVCAQKLEAEHINSEVGVFPYFNLKRSKDAVDVCKYAQPDILIIQCHYIFNPHLFKKINQRIHPKRKNETKPYNLNAKYSDYRVDNTDRTFKPDLKFWLRQFIRHFFHQLLFYKVVSKSESLAYIDSFFKAVKESGVKRVIILSPFPSTDLVLNRYRKIGSKLIYEKTAEFGYEFIDVYSLIQKQFPDRIFTIDDIHLNKEAHLFLGKYLGEYLINSMVQKPVPNV